MKIYLCRHGEAVNVDVDPQSPLNENGIQQAKRLAIFLVLNKISVQQVYHSGKMRAQETAQILAASIAPAQKLNVLQGLHPMDDARAITTEINEWTEDTLLVSHLPFLSKLVSTLVVGNENFDIVNFSPATMVCLQREYRKWSILWVLRPEILA